MVFDFEKEPGKKLLERPINRDVGEPLVSIITPFTMPVNTLSKPITAF